MRLPRGFVGCDHFLFWLRYIAALYSYQRQRMLVSVIPGRTSLPIPSVELKHLNWWRCWPVRGWWDMWGIWLAGSCHEQLCLNRGIRFAEFVERMWVCGSCRAEELRSLACTMYQFGTYSKNSWNPSSPAALYSSNHRFLGQSVRREINVFYIIKDRPTGHLGSRELVFVILLICRDKLTLD